MIYCKGLCKDICLFMVWVLNFIIKYYDIMNIILMYDFIL